MYPNLHTCDKEIRKHACVHACVVHLAALQHRRWPWCTQHPPHVCVTRRKSVRFVGWADWVDCRCSLSFVFLGVARRLELSPCNTEKAPLARHRPERQHNAGSNRRKQCSPNETKPYSKPTLPRKRQTTPTNGHTPRRWKPTHTRLTYTICAGVSRWSMVGFVRSALLLAFGTCIVLSFEAMPGLCFFLRVTL